jgi:hypothetical protein
MFSWRFGGHEPFPGPVFSSDLDSVYRKVQGPPCAAEAEEPEEYV